ncbi:unnamed protein product [Camellia sinensis]
MYKQSEDNKNAPQSRGMHKFKARTPYWISMEIIKFNGSICNKIAYKPKKNKGAHRIESLVIVHLGKIAIKNMKRWRSKEQKLRHLDHVSNTLYMSNN